MFACNRIAVVCLLAAMAVVVSWYSTAPACASIEREAAAIYGGSCDPPDWCDIGAYTVCLNPAPQFHEHDTIGHCPYIYKYSNQCDQEELVCWYSGPDPITWCIEGPALCYGTFRTYHCSAINQPMPHSPFVWFDTYACDLVNSAKRGCIMGM